MMRKYFVIGYLFLSLSAPGQMLTNQNMITIPADLDVYIEGGLTNQGIINNHGTLWVEEDWTNEGNYNEGIGTVALFGASRQVVDHRDQAFYHLNILGGGAKTFVSSASIRSKILFDDGIVQPYQNARLVLLDDTKVAGGSKQSYVSGELYQKGTGYKFFPIGNDSGYYPIEFLQVQGYHPEYAVKVVQGKLNQQAGVITDFFWEASVSKGTIDHTPIRISFAHPNEEENLALAVGQSREGNIAIIADVLTKTLPYGYSLETSEAVAGQVFAVAKTDGSESTQRAFYCSNTLSPNAFSPEDRTIRVFGDMLVPEDFHFVVYNRWGLKVFETTSLTTMKEEGWDGRHQQSGDLLPQGNYPFAMVISRADGSVFKEKGILTIIR